MYKWSIDNYRPPSIPELIEETQPEPEEPINPEDYYGENVPDFFSGYDWELTPPPEYGGSTPQYTPEAPPGYTGPSYDPTTAPTRSGIDQEALTRLLSGDPAYNIDPAATEQYFRDVIYDPAMHEYENVTRPGFLESVGNLHSGHRANLERSSRQELARDLSAQRAGLYYADELSRRDALENAAARQTQGVGLAQSQYGQDVGVWQSENQMAQNRAAQGLQQWAQESGNWEAMQQFMMEADQFQSTFDFQKWLQDSNNWATLQELGMTQEQIELMIEQAHFNQWLTPYQLMIQALGQQGSENIVTPGYNPFTTGINVNTDI